MYVVDLDFAFKVAHQQDLFIPPGKIPSFPHA